MGILLVAFCAALAAGVAAAIMLRRKCRAWRKTATGQTEKSGCSTGRSALPSITDVVRQICQVRKVTNTDSKRTRL
jgi:hypothetical protein